MRQSPGSPKRTTWAVLALTLMLVHGAWAAGKFKVLYSFKGGDDGIGPSGNLISDANGNLYGTTVQGGGTTACNGPYYKGCGIVFELVRRPNGHWKERVLYSFQNGTEYGVGLNGSLVFDQEGNLYGTAYYGGAGFTGTVFQLAPGSSGWSETTIYQFCSQGCSDGESPGAGVIFDKSGNLFGTTTQGGTNDGGVAFKLTPGSSGWTESVLYNFLASLQDGWYPGGLIQDADENLYGTTTWGGDYSWPCTPGDGCGVVFELSLASQGWNYTVLHRLDGSRDGAFPAYSMVRDKQGNVYGTTTSDGAFGCGTVFELSPGAKSRWSYRLLYNPRDAVSAGSLTLDAAGNLYGATAAAMTSSTCQGSGGEIFKLSRGSHARWNYSTVYKVSGVSSGLILDQKGNLYGTMGGGYGAVFELTP